jgi:hypothetical protein
MTVDSSFAIAIIWLGLCSFARPPYRDDFFTTSEIIWVVAPAVAEKDEERRRLRQQLQVMKLKYHISRAGGHIVLRYTS